MGVKKIAGNRWQVRWTDDVGKDHKKVMAEGSTKEQAETFLRDSLVRVDRIKHGLEVREKNPEGLTLGEVAKRYIRDRDDRLQSAVRCHIIETPLGSVALDKVTPARIVAHIEGLQPTVKGKRKTPLSPTTRNHVRKHLVQIFEWSKARGLYLGDNPARATKQLKVTRKALTTLTAEEAMRLVMAVDQPWRGIFAVALHGLRKGEIWGLDVADVDLKAKVLNVRRSHSRDLTKNGRERVVPIHPALLGAITEARDFAIGRGGPLFPGLEGKRRHERTAMEVPLKHALKLAKIGRPIRFHDLRHTAATLLLRSGAGLAQVQRILGHSSIQVTVDRYGHLVTDDLQDAMSRVQLTLPTPRAVKG